jgi:protoheme IX farnesyltransferase
MFLAAGAFPSPWLMLAATFGTFLSSASSSVFNHLLDSDLDQIMKRTRSRPVASKEVPEAIAFAFGIILGSLSLLILYFFTTPLAAAVALGANLFYALIYTLVLKRHTVQNIVIGGAAGAVGPLIGWAAVDATGIGWPAWTLFMVVFFWTPPHFWALALKYKSDYAQAKVPMLPVIAGDETTRKQMFLYCLTLIPIVFALYGGGQAGLIYLIPSMAATIYFVWLTFKLYRSHENTLAMPVFHYSCLYLFGIFGSLALDQLL